MKDNETPSGKDLAGFINTTISFINKSAFKVGAFIYGTTAKTPKADFPLEPPLPTAVAATELFVGPPCPEPDTRLNHIPTAHDKEEDEFTKGLMAFEYELKTLRTAHSKAQDDVERNALRFKILRLERKRHEYITEHS